MRIFLYLCLVLGIFISCSNGFSIQSSRIASTKIITVPRRDFFRSVGRTVVPIRQSATASNLVQPIGNLELSAKKAVGKLLLTCAVGIAGSKAGLVDKSSLSALSKLIFGIFQPCLLFVNIVSTVAKLGNQGAALWYLPAAALVQIVLGLVFGKWVSYLIYGSQASSEKDQLLMCTAFGNSGPLPLVFVDALLKTHPDATMLPQSIGFISLYLLGWSPLFWILGPLILQSSSNLNSGKSGWRQVLDRVLSPPVLASLFGVIVGSIPAIRDPLLFDHPGELRPLHLLFESMRTLGSAYLPAVLLVLAGSLVPSRDSATSEPHRNKESGSLLKQVVAIYACRFLLMPIVALNLLPRLRGVSANLANLLNSKPLVLVLLMEACMPSAQNSAVILQLLGDVDGAAKISQVLMMLYVLGIPALTYWLATVMRTVEKLP